jgi:hypothetical protein
MSKTMAWRTLGRVGVTVHGPETPRTSEWLRYLNELRAIPRRADTRVVVYSFGGGPDGTQRQELAAAVGRDPAPVAIITRSRIMRAISTLCALFNPKLRVFSPDQEDAAFNFLELSAEERKMVRLVAGELEREIAPAPAIAVPD